MIRPSKKKDFSHTREQKEGVKNFHETEVFVAELSPPTVPRPSFISATQNELDQALDRYQRQESEVEFDRYHCSNTISEQKPGPMASINP